MDETGGGVIDIDDQPLAAVVALLATRAEPAPAAIADLLAVDLERGEDGWPA